MARRTDARLSYADLLRCQSVRVRTAPPAQLEHIVANLRLKACALGCTLLRCCTMLHFVALHQTCRKPNKIGICCTIALESVFFLIPLSWRRADSVVRLSESKQHPNEHGASVLSDCKSSNCTSAARPNTSRISRRSKKLNNCNGLRV